MSNFLLKQDLTATQQLLVNEEVRKKSKNKIVLYIVWWFSCCLGFHRFYLGDKGMGFAMAFTLGGFGIWALIDGLFIGKRLDEVNDQIENDIILQVKSFN